MGVQVVYVQYFFWGVLVLQIKGIVCYQIENDQRQIYGGYVLNFGQIVVFLVDKLDIIWFEFSVGLLVVFSCGILFYLYYEVVVDYSVISLQIVSVGI